MIDDSRECALTFSEMRREIGAAIWLLVAYADMAATGWSASDGDLAVVLGTSTDVVRRWKEKLVQAGLIHVERTGNGETRILIYRDVLFANSVHGAGVLSGADRATVWKESDDLSATDREFLRHCGIQAEESCPNQQ